MIDLDPIRTRLTGRYGPDVHPWGDAIPTRAAELADLYNVLNGPQLMAVDPKACLGDPCFDALDYAFQANSADIAKAAGLDEERVAAWWRAFSWMA